jgi:hypothetical protein
MEENIKMETGKQGWRVLIGFIWHRIWSDGRLLRTCTEPSGSIKDGEFLS